MSEQVLNNILEVFYILIGLQLLYTAFRILKSSTIKRSMAQHYFGFC